MFQDICNREIALQHFNILCSQHSPAHFFCINKFCKSNIILCNDTNCKCQLQKHHDCSFTKVKPLLSKIIDKKNKLSQNQDLKLFISKTQILYNQLIDNISENRDKLLKDIQNWGMCQEEVLLLQKLQSQKFDQIDGKLINNVLCNIDIAPNKLIKKPKDIQVDKLIQKKSNQLKRFIKQMQLQYTNSSTRINSKIVQSQKNYQKLQKFFTNNIVSMQLLYRATQNDFSAEKFHQKCDNIRDTVVLIKTQGDKIIGGYSPQCWDKSDKYKYNRKSFVFSISKNIKYECISRDKSIYCYPNQGPCFGGKKSFDSAKNKSRDYDDIYIGNGDVYGQFHIGSAYGNIGGNKILVNQTRKQFCGSTSQTPETKVKQWQVFKVHLLTSNDYHNEDPRFKKNTVHDDSQSQSQSDQSINEEQFERDYQYQGNQENVSQNDFQDYQ